MSKRTFTRRWRGRLFAALIILCVLAALAYYATGRSRSITLELLSNTKADAYLGETRFSSPGSVQAEEGSASILLRSKGYVDALLRLDIGSESHQKLRVDTVPCPLPSEVPGGSYCAFPAFCHTDGSLYYLGHRGSSFISLDASGGQRDLNADRLAQISSVTWSPSGSMALLRVDPAGDGLFLINSPVACKSATTFLYNTLDNSFRRVAVPLAQGASFDCEGNIYFGTMESGISFIIAAPSTEVGPDDEDSLRQKRSFRLPGDCLVPYCYVSPDGESVAFTTTTPGKDNMNLVDLSILDTKTGAIERLTYSGYIHGASWSPDGGLLVYEYDDPDSQVPHLLAWDAKRRQPTPMDLKTYIEKSAWYSGRVLLAGIPYDIESALTHTDKATPDSLIYCSPSTGAYAYILPAERARPQNFTDPVIAGDTLYYCGSLILRKLDISGLKATLRSFERSDSSPIKPIPSEETHQR